MHRFGAFDPDRPFAAVDDLRPGRAVGRAAAGVQDTLLSLVASTQLTSNDMLRIGDWIEMPQSNADGFVKDIALHTVKVQNWDNTVTTVPTYAVLRELPQLPPHV